ncbi:MAG: DUF1641 domain-containing protein [Desulfurococcales archaeon]|nr:DUF1641 domain-containing protein [Desulfurococcales archaeon]
MVGMSERDPLAQLLTELENPEFQEVLSKLLELVKNLEKSGLLDMLVAITEPEVINRIFDMVITTGTMKLGDSIEGLLNKLGDVAEALQEDSKPASLSELLASLKDPEVAKGLGRLIALLKALGK